LIKVPRPGKRDRTKERGRTVFTSRDGISLDGLGVDEPGGELGRNKKRKRMNAPLTSKKKESVRVRGGTL